MYITRTQTSLAKPHMIIKEVHPSQAEACVNPIPITRSAVMFHELTTVESSQLLCMCSTAQGVK